MFSDSAEIVSHDNVMVIVDYTNFYGRHLLWYTPVMGYQPTVSGTGSCETRVCLSERLSIVYQLFEGNILNKIANHYPLYMYYPN